MPEENQTDTPEVDVTDQPDVQEALGELTGDTPEGKGEADSGAGPEDASLDTKETVVDDDQVTEGEPDTAQAPVDLGSLMGELGLGEKYQTPEEALRGFAQAQKLIGARDRYADIGRDVEPHWDSFQEYMKQQQDQAAADSEPVWQPPHEYDDEMSKLEVLANAAQMSHARGETLDAWEAIPQKDKDKVVDYLNYRQTWWNKVFNHPEAFISEVVFPGVKRHIEGMFEKRDQNQVAQDFVRRNKDILDNPEAYRRLDQLMAPHVGVPGEQAAYIVRLEAENSKLRGSAPTQPANDNHKKEDAKRRLASRGGRPGKKPSMDIDVSKMSYDDIADHVLKLEAAGALPDSE